VVLHCRPDSSIRAFEITDLDLGGYLAGELPGYMIPSHFMKVDELPLTPSGKINRKRLPEPELEVREETTAPGADEVREKLTRVWSEILKIEPEKIDNDTSFFDLGGNSLRSVILLARIQKELNVEMTLTGVFEAPTIKEMAQYINKAAKEEFTSIEPLEEKEYYPLSLRQKRFYILQHMDETMVNNTPHIMVLQGDLERSRIERAFRDLIKRHESLRTGFETVGREPVQRVHQPGDLDFRVDYQELKKSETEAERIRNFVKPFDLSCAPLLRVGLIKLAENKHVLMFDMHHIITDGMSMQIFVKESAALYAGEQLPPIRLQYRDFSGWQNRLYETGKIKQQEEYWLKQFEKKVPRLQLPTDYPRPKVMRLEGDSLFFEIGKEETAALRTLVKTEDATIFMVLLAVYNVLLSKLTGQQDIVVGTGIVGRKHADLTGIIGLFFNTLALRNYPLENIEFRTFLKDLKERTLTSFENEDYPFDELVQELRRRGSLTMEANRNPVFETIFSMHNFDVGTVGAADTELPGLTLRAYPYENKTARYDLFLRGVDVDNKIMMELEYSTTLFNQATAERIVNHYKEVLHQVLENKDIKLKDITLSSQLLDAKASRSPEDYKNFGF
jgi:acyl carrier protein